MNAGDEFRRRLRKLAFAWAALLALVLSSLALAYVPLGAGNLAVGLGIALAKGALVAALYMELARETAAVRIAAAVALATWLLLAGLGSVDYATRHAPPAAYEPGPR